MEKKHLKIIVFLIITCLFTMKVNSKETELLVNPTLEPQSSSIEECKLDLSPIYYASIGDSSGIHYVISGNLNLSKGNLSETGKPTVQFIETSTLNFITPILPNLAAELSSQANQEGQRLNSCNNSFGGAQVWLSSNIPPRIQAKAEATKRTCTCAKVPCPSWKYPGRTCNKCIIQNVGSGQFNGSWRIDAKIDENNSKVLLQTVVLQNSTTLGGGFIFDLFKDLGLVDLFDRLFRINIENSMSNISKFAESLGNITSGVSLPETPINLKLNTVNWSQPNVSNVQPYALTINRSFSLYEKSACVVSECIRKYGFDGLKNGECPEL